MHAGQRSFMVGLFVVVGWGVTAAAGTVVPPGPVAGVWTLAGSPYEVQGDIFVSVGAELEVEPAVAVLFQGACGLTVQGTLQALGEPGAEISWTGTERWQGLRFENHAQESVLRGCFIAGATQAVTVVDARLALTACTLADHVTAVHLFAAGMPDPAPVRIEECVIRDCQQHGIFIVENSRAEVIDCEITRCALDGQPRGAVQLSCQSAQGGNDPLLSGNWIHHNTWQGLTAFDVTGGGRIHPTVIDNTIEYNYTGVYLLYSSGTFRDNRIRHNFQAGNPNSGAGVMVAGSTAHPLFTGTITTGNYTGYYVIQGATINLGDLHNADPDDDGGNQIYGNLDGSGHLWSVYSASTADITAENNRWDSDDPVVIAETIFDGHDNPAYGLVDFDPILPLAGVDDGAGGAGHAAMALGTPGPAPVVRFTLAQPAAGARLLLLDAQGRRVRVLTAGPLVAGVHRLAWDGADSRGRPLPAGIYHWRLEQASDLQAGRLVLLR